MEDKFKKLIELYDMSNENFFEFAQADFNDYLETRKNPILENNTEYLSAKNEIETMKRKYPNLRDILEEEETKNLNESEVKALIQIRELESKIEMIENRIYFKLGLKEILKITLL